MMGNHDYHYIQGSCEGSNKPDVNYTVSLRCHICGDTIHRVENVSTDKGNEFIYEGQSVREIRGCPK